MSIVLSLGFFCRLAISYTCLALISAEVLSQHRRVRVRVVAADHYQPIEAKALADGAAGRKLSRCLNLVTSSADNIEASLSHIRNGAAKLHLIAVVGDQVLCQRNILAVHDTNGTSKETEEKVCWVARLQEIKDTRDGIVATGRLATGEHHADLYLHE